jgi:transposase InsO family protein
VAQGLGTDQAEPSADVESAWSSLPSLSRSARSARLPAVTGLPGPQADQPNECWQADFTHYPLANGAGTEILTWLDDHSRYALSFTAHQRITGPIVLTACGRRASRPHPARSASLGTVR